MVPSSIQHQLSPRRDRVLVEPLASRAQTIISILAYLLSDGLASQCGGVTSLVLTHAILRNSTDGGRQILNRKSTDLLMPEYVRIHVLILMFGALGYIHIPISIWICPKKAGSTL